MDGLSAAERGILSFLAAQIVLLVLLPGTMK
jgi:hypothetical protein